MTVLTPEFLQTKTYDAIRMRYLLQTFVTEGVGGGSDYAVSQRAAGANMSVDVAAGRAWVQGDDTARQGVYHAVNDGTVNVTIGTADPTNPRVDRLVLRVYDSSIVGGSRDEAALEVVPGTPTAGATLGNLNGAASVPNSALLLANVLVGAAASSITTAAIGNVAGQSTSVGAARAIPFVAAALTSQAVWTNQPSGLTELFGDTVRQQYDLSGITQARLICNVTTAGAAGAVLRAQYSTNGGSTWNYLDGATGPEVAISATGVIASSWISVAAAAKSDVQLRIVGLSGNGTADPAIPRVTLQVR